MNTASVVFTEIQLGIELGIEKAQQKELGKKESGLFSQPNKRLRKPSVPKMGRDFCAFGSMSAPALALMANKSIDKRINKRASKTIIHQQVMSTKKLTKTYNNKYTT